MTLIMQRKRIIIIGQALLIWVDKRRRRITVLQERFLGLFYKMTRTQQTTDSGSFIRHQATLPVVLLRWAVRR